MAKSEMKPDYDELQLLMKLMKTQEQLCSTLYGLAMAMNERYRDENNLLERNRPALRVCKG